MNEREKKGSLDFFFLVQKKCGVGHTFSFELDKVWDTDTREAGEARESERREGGVHSGVCVSIDRCFFFFESFSMERPQAAAAIEM